MSSIQVTHKQHLAQLISISQWAHQKGFTPATGGNFSMRVDDKSCLISASGVDKGQLDCEHFLHLSWQHQVLGGQGKPSDEAGIHTQLYQLDPNIHVVIHIHSMASTLLSRLCEQPELQINGWEMQKTLEGITSHEQCIRLAVFDNNQNIRALAEQITMRWQTDELKWGLLVRGHGLYAWSYSIEKALRQVEGLSYLLDCELAYLQLKRK